MFQRQTSGYVKSASSELFLAFSSTELKAQASFSDYFCPVSVGPQTFFYTLPTSTPEPLDRIQPNLHKTSLGNAVRVCENDWPRPLVLKMCLYFSKFFSKKKNHLVRKAKTFAEASLDTSSVDSSLSKSHFLGRRGGVGLLKYSAKSQLTIQENFRSIESNFE